MTGARILVVDDEPQIRRVLKSALSGQGYEVFDARTGEEALQAFRERRFDLLLLDVNMPGMSGLETCRQIRPTSDVAIIMLTVRDAEQDKVDALDAGADDYITKPFSTPELMARIRAALRRLPVSATSSVVLDLGGIQVHPSDRRVVVRGQAVRLTPKEFDLLLYLASSPNVTITHTKLLQAVWGPDYGDQVEYLRTFVNQLRKKIEEDPAHPVYLVTEPWIGYRLQTSAP
ncbi:MAG: response regulator transcription factor [Acidobacteriales bacterium]|nr:response regulator transcription factor [Terriglobales bacterium]